MIEKLVKKIKNRRLIITVLGSGYVGLTTAALFADAGFHVTAVDLKLEVINAVNSGRSPINEPSLNELIARNVKAGRLKAIVNSKSSLTPTDAFLISVQTPISKNKKPNLFFLSKALKDVGQNLKKEALVIIISTVPPGTMQKKLKPKLESLSGLTVDKDFYLAYVPERISPGNAIKEFVETPRLIGGIGPKSTKVAAELFKTVCKAVIETNAQTAEIAKLAENTFRDINIAFANQLSLICEQQGVDVTEVIKLANTHPRVNIHTPGPGVGGPCLPKDPYLLISNSKSTDYDIIKTARKINDYMPIHIVKLITKVLKNSGKNVKNSKIAILGTAYKANVDDARLSPAELIIRKLISLHANVTVYDPYCNQTFGAQKADSLHEAVKGADCIAIITDHIVFKNLGLQEIRALMADKPAIIDGRRILNPRETESVGLLYYGIGFGKQRNN
ncbi:MAG: nucleotide sugar dehydrogenase [Candidatus Methanomethyliaceae archaeon]